jgi:uncharacterized protein (TIGR02001 family)
LARFAAACLIFAPSEATAQVGIVISAFSDDRFRGYSLSDGHPVGILDLSYDDPSGFYGALSGGVVAGNGDGLAPLKLAVNGGYAKRIRSGLTVDFGAVHSRYSHYSGIASGRSYTEGYVGLAGRFVGARISVSPDYIGGAHWTLHGELNGHVDLSRRWFLDGEVGALIPISSASYQQSSHPQLDARVGIARRFGRVTLHAAMTARGKGPDIYAGHGHRRAALIIGISSAL